MEIIEKKNIYSFSFDDFGAYLVAVISKAGIRDFGTQYILRIDEMQLENGRINCIVCNPKLAVSYVEVLFTYYQVDGLIKCEARTHDWWNSADKYIYFSATRRITKKLLTQIFEQLS